MTISGHQIRLRWDTHFKGHAPADASADGFTGTGYQMLYRWEQLNVGGERKFRLNRVTVTVRVLKDKCWVKPDRRTDELLVHEQGHYDITALLARDLDRDLTALKNSQQVFGTLSDLESAIAVKRAPIDDLMQKLQSNITDGRYDVQTDHSRNADEQRKWNAAFAWCRVQESRTLRDALASQNIQSAQLMPLWRRSGRAVAFQDVRPAGTARQRVPGPVGLA